MNSAWKLGMIAALWAACAGPARAAMGLRTKFAEVEVQNLRIGQSYSMADLVNFPLRIMNTGDEPVPLRVIVHAPGPADMKEGYEAIPDAGWIELQQSTFTVPPGLEAVTDVIINVPNDESLLGRSFCVYMWTLSENVASTGVGLKSRMLLTISSEKPTDEELKRRFVRKRLANLNFSLSPMETLASGVPVGRRIALKDLKAGIKLINPESESYNFRLTPVAFWETSITPPRGYENSPDPKWLEPGKPVMEVGPESITPVDLYVRVPDEPRYRGRKYLLLLRAEILEQDIPAYAYVKVLIETLK